MKRGTKVKVTFTGTVVARPIKMSTEGVVSPVQIRVDGLKGWWAVVPESAVEVVEQET